MSTNMFVIIFEMEIYKIIYKAITYPFLDGHVAMSKQNQCPRNWQVQKQLPLHSEEHEHCSSSHSVYILLQRRQPLISTVLLSYSLNWERASTEANSEVLVPNC